MKIKAIILSLFLANTCFSQQANYQAGDTLSVFTLGGLKLREGFSLSSKVISTMNLGDKVVVIDHFNAAREYSQTIEGFSGHWIRVKFDTLTGYAFDGFLSSLPVPSQGLIKKAEKAMSVYAKEEKYQLRGQEMKIALDEYIATEFQLLCEPVEYYDPKNGKGGHHVKIQKMKRGFTRIHHSGWESYGTELLLPNVRFSEIKNLIILLAQRSGVDNDLLEELKTRVKALPENNVDSQEVIALNMFEISINCYQSESNGLKWSIVFSCASS